ncbi:MAG TPA: acyltransferase [Syntrophorhabdales bacterium]|nr:acyltransferase [Syntrophorhabdales bacterium]
MGGDKALTNDLQTAPDRQYALALGYLKAFIILLVVLHHAACAYLPLIVPTTPASSLVEHMHSLRAISPVSDQQRSFFFLLVTSFNDKFFMSLMFFISGLFVWNSLRAKGSRLFLRDRFVRLGLPFLVMAALGPLTYYTSYLQSGGSEGLPGFWRQWTSLKDWPDGPAWFICVLLAFDIIVVPLAALMARARASLYEAGAAVGRRPILLFALLLLVSAIAYLPMASLFNPYWSWWSWGPFKFQTSRIFLYLAYFLIGALLGAVGIERTCLTRGSALARLWAIWAVVAFFAFVISLGAGRPGTNPILAGGALLFSCAASCLAFLALFLRFARKRRRVFDSLSSNSYGVFVIHYVVVAWLLYAMLKTPLPALAKGFIVFLCALLLCWGSIAAIRRIPGVARVI